MTQKMTEQRVKWYGHIKRTDERHVLRRVLDGPQPGKGRRGRHNTMWKDSCKRDMESVGLKVEDLLNRTKWKNDIPNHFGEPR